MKVTVVVDNSVPISAKVPFIGEHGLSLLVEIDSFKILLDAGQSNAVVHNLSLLGIHPCQLDAIVISHGHYDHTGGIPHILRHRDQPIPIYAHDEIFRARYSVGSGGKRFIGVPFIKEEAIALGAEWKLNHDPVEIAPNLWFSGGIPRKTEFENGDAKLTICDENGCDCQDSIIDDTVLYYSDKKGLIVIGGCTHSGMINTIRRGFEITGQTRLAGWVGGTHLGPVLKGQQELTISMLEEYAPEFIAANHCTGFEMMVELRNRFGHKFIPAFVGTVIEI